MMSVGEKLRRERLQRGMDLVALSSVTRINRSYLEAIEAGDTSQLPGGFFYRSFVRQYATALGLDPVEVEGELEREREAEAPVLDAALEQASFPVKAPDPIVTESNRRYLGTGRLSAYVFLLVAVLAGCSAFYAWFHRLETAPVAKRADTPAVAVQRSAPAAAPAVTAGQAPSAAPAAEQTLPPQPADPAKAESTVPVTPVAASSAPRAPAVSPDDRVVVKLYATELTWLSVTADGKTVFAGLLQPNQEITLGGKEKAQIRVGNAGGLAVSLNGKTIGPVGNRGEVRSVVLTPDGYHVVEPAGSL